jgi:hypothetical protein
MNLYHYVPNSNTEAANLLRNSLRLNLAAITREEFVSVWCAIAYLFPGLHPDAFDEKSGGWPSVLLRFAEEAWRRAEVGQLSDEELYPCDAQWAGLYDRMAFHLPEEMKRRGNLAMLHGRLPRKSN